MTFGGFPLRSEQTSYNLAVISGIPSLVFVLTMKPTQWLCRMMVSNDLRSAGDTTISSDFACKGLGVNYVCGQ
jgi:hypothetical protein